MTNMARQKAHNLAVREQVALVTFSQAVAVLVISFQIFSQPLVAGKEVQELMNAVKI